MEQKLKNAWNRIVLFFAAMLGHAVAFAQEKELDVNVDINSGGEAAWYSNPVAWVVGAAIFIILLVAVSRGGGRTTADR
ncbi:hypothetical protein [Telluribacter sp. SYSU D00476]|uniref:hypothetical protein n=1 Tax=Telluribacter sp. SYSU D00476 TaxID=2811430 RepID=UPI001FF112A4|nr:hypothetical protein [Telluribacter sp. SYSU D00476]